jgi:hypothetical protein
VLWGAVVRGARLGRRFGHAHGRLVADVARGGFGGAEVGVADGSTRLRPGKVAGTADVKTAPVYLPGEPVTASVWAKASGTGAEVRLDGFDASGALLASSSAVSVPTTWTRLTVTLAAGSTALGASVFVLPTINATSSPPSNLWIAGAQLEYAATASAWDLGFGSPRVVITAGPGRSSWMPGYSDSTLQLAEV